MSYLSHKNVLLGITGSIAAYKSADLVRRLREAGATVRVAMTENAKRFITPLTMQAVSGFPIHDDLFDPQAEAAMGHIELARWADLVLVAPATADFMTRLAVGEANDLLTTICTATSAPIALAPAMNQGMWKHTLTQENLSALEKRGIAIFGPTEGSQACGDTGPGRMMEPVHLIEKVSELFATGTLAGLKVLVNAGPTREYIDPVRFITNGSSGKMGYALARAAREAGADVTLISGPVALPKPNKIQTVDVISAEEMAQAVMKEIPQCDIFIAAAAVGDYRVQEIAQQKIHKQDADLQLHLTRTPDIAESVGKLAKKPFIVGFAAETDAVIANAKAKCQRKNMDMIVANRVGFKLGMGSEENEVTVLTKESEITFPLTQKNQLVRQLIKIIAEQYQKRTS